MKRYALTIILTLGVASTSLAQTPSSKIAPSKGWHNSLDSARAQAQQTGKPMLVIFRCDP